MLGIQYLALGIDCSVRHLVFQDLVLDVLSSAPGTCWYSQVIVLALTTEQSLQNDLVDSIFAHVCWQLRPYTWPRVTKHVLRGCRLVNAYVWNILSPCIVPYKVRSLYNF